MRTTSDYWAAPNSQKTWLIRGAAVAVTLTLLAAMAPLVWAAVSAAAGIAVLTGMAAAGFAVFLAVPLAMQKLENRARFKNGVFWVPVDEPMPTGKRQLIEGVEW